MLERRRPSASSTTTGPSAAGRAPTSGAVRVAGDIVPGRLVAVSITTPAVTEPVYWSGALQPKNPYTLEQPAQAVVGRDMRRVMKGSDPAAYVFPLDAPAGAKVVVHPVNPDLPLPTVHLVDVATGTQLDLARDITPSSVNSRHTPATPDLLTGQPKDGKLAPAPADVNGLIPLEPGWVQIVPKLRVLTFDKPTKPGQVRIVVPADIQADGLWVEVQQPNTHITLAGIGSELNFSFGDSAEITASLMADKTPINGATVGGFIELPDHSRGSDLTFSSTGNGQYVAKVPLASADWKYIGVWGLHLKATGSSGGASFERDVDSAFGYYPAHAQMVGVGTPVVSRGADGLVDQITVDVDVETLVDDRFSVKGVLTYTAADGTEHSLAAAQTGQSLSAGKGTIPLRFDASAMAFAKADGPYHLRDLVLVSQAGSIPQHRIGRAVDVVTPAVLAREIRFPKQIPIPVQELIDNGDIDPVK